MASSREQSPLPLSPVHDQGQERDSSPPSLKAYSNKPDVVLVVRKQPPAYVFSEEWFHVEFGLEFSKSSSDVVRTAGGEVDAEFGLDLVPIKPSASSSSKQHLTEGSREEQDVTGLLVAEPSTIWFSLRGTPPRRKQRVQCQIRNETHGRDKAMSYCIRLSPNRHTTMMMFPDLEPVVTTRITLVNHKILVDADSVWENVWYKDEGGRDKSMTVVASLVDRDGHVFAGNQIPLQLGLYYNSEDHEPIKVMKQDILRLIGGGKARIDETTGKATVRFRIEDVSKNHQGQDFKIQIGVPPRGFKDVAPGFTPSVNVRSKRNKRQRSNLLSGPAVASPEGRPTGYEEPAGSDSSFAPADLPRLREALQGVFRWAEEVVTGIVALQWQIIGYHQHADGSPDYTRPYHNIPNPDAIVSRIMGMYSETTREQLMTILHAIDRGSQDYSAMIPPPSIPRATEDDEGYHMQQRGVPVQSLGRSHYPPHPPGGMHPSMTHESFRDKPPDMRRPEMMNYPHNSMPPYSHGMRPRPPQPMPPGGMHPPTIHPDHLHPMAVPMSNNPNPQAFRESEVAYVLAKQFKSVRSGDRLGFPAYSHSKELLGFYRESNVGVPQFIPIQRHAQDFGPMEIMDAIHILQDALHSKSEAVHALKDWGSMASLLDHALVYDWSKDISTGGGGGRAHSRASTPSD